MSCATFPKFLQLPGELRNRIWQAFIHEEQDHDRDQIIPARIETEFPINPQKDSGDLVLMKPRSVLRSVCKESRSWATFNETSDRQENISNFELRYERDTLWLPRYDIIHDATTRVTGYERCLNLPNWKGPDIAKLALPIECLHELLMSNSAKFIKSFLLVLYRKNVRDLIFVVGCGEAELCWGCRFVTPRTENDSLFRSDKARNIFFDAHDVLGGKKGILNRRRDMTCAQAEKIALKLFRRILLKEYIAIAENHVPSISATDPWPDDFYAMAMDYYEEVWGLDSVKIVEVVHK